MRGKEVKRGSMRTTGGEEVMVVFVIRYLCFENPTIPQYLCKLKSFE